MFKEGDHIRLIDEVGEGHVVSVQGSTITANIDGFVFDLDASTIVKIEFDNLINPETIKHSKDVSKKLKSIQERSSIQERMDNAKTVYELDLHIEELTDRYHQMSHGDILEYQLRCCRQFIQEAYNKHYRRVVLIHGRGEGVLKMEIHRYLDRMPNVDYHDAPYRTYGYGATEVVIHR